MNDGVGDANHLSVYFNEIREFGGAPLTLGAGIGAGLGQVDVSLNIPGNLALVPVADLGASVTDYAIHLGGLEDSFWTYAGDRR